MYNVVIDIGTVSGDGVEKEKKEKRLGFCHFGIAVFCLAHLHHVTL